MTARPRRWLDGVPLRVRLVAALLGLVAVGLLATGAAVTALLRGYLVSRVDAELRDTAPSIVGRVERGQEVVPRRPNGGFELPSRIYVRANAPDGSLLGALQGRPPDGEPLPAPVELAAPRLLARAGDGPFTVPADRSDLRWRVLVSGVGGTPARPAATVTVALPLDEVTSTVGRLVLIELLGGVAVLAVLGGLGYLAVRSSLAPLVEVERTAEAIAAGDLGRRVPVHDPRTEVGRLTGALNGMLAQIERAFRDRAASERQARASEERMRRFVADASHELRTPLTSIRGFAELYRQGAVPTADEVATVLRRIEDEAARMGLLVEDLLLLARLDSQRPLEHRPVDLLGLAGDAVLDARAVQPDRRVDVEVGSGGPAVVLGDEGRLRQVVGNLVSNALRHTPRTAPVTVRVDSADGAAVLEVTDGGPGMAPADAARVFERFFRADASRHRGDGGGSGLGLSIVAALVAAHGGTVDVTTAPGAGSTFRVRLPLAGPRGTDGDAQGRTDLTPDGQAAPRSLQG